jgi:polysaccharide export outer membrane protein
MSGLFLSMALKNPCRLAAAALGLLLALAGCARQSDVPMAASATAAVGAGLDLEAYRLGPGDKLKITIFGHPQESGNFEIDGLGYLPYPLLGRVPAKDKTVAQLTEYLKVELNRTFIVDPRVSVEVLNYRPFYIYGEVNRAGSYPYVSGLTVRRAVAIAGGFTRRAREAPVTLVREDRSGVMKYDAQLEVPVLPGDIIEVERRLF